MTVCNKEYYDYLGYTILRCLEETRSWENVGCMFKSYLT